MKVSFKPLGYAYNQRRGNLQIETSFGRSYKMHLKLADESDVHKGAQSIFFTLYRDMWKIG